MHEQGGSDTRVAITGVGYATPAELVSSAEVEARISGLGRLPIPGGRLESITGIRSRYMVGPGEYASTLGADAGRVALADAGTTAGRCRPARLRVREHGSARARDCPHRGRGFGIHAPVFDVKNACNSFINGVEIAEAFILSGRPDECSS